MLDLNIHPPTQTPTNAHNSCVYKYFVSSSKTSLKHQIRSNATTNLEVCVCVYS